MTGEQNPLVVPILDILKARSDPLSEYELIGLLKEPLALIGGSPGSKPLALFHTHFLVMNALYQLQQSLLGDGYYLVVSALSISLQLSGGNASTAIGDMAAEQSVRSYYLDWKNFDSTTEEDVSALLAGFWQAYSADDKQLSAYRQLGLEPGTAWKEIQKHYRRLVAAKHPDRGGSTADFVAIREAYEVLVIVHGK